MIWFRKSRKQGKQVLESVYDFPLPCEPREQVIIARPIIVYPSHAEICAMTKSLQEHFNAYTCIFIEIKKHPQYQEAILKYYLYIADKCNEYFDSFEDLRLFAANLS